MNYKHEILFSLKVWLFSVFLSTIIVLLFFLITSNPFNQDKAIEYLMVLLFLGLFLSIPSLILFTIGVIRYNRKIGIEYPRFSIFLVALVVCFLPIILVGLNLEEISIILITSYIATITYGIFTFKLKPQVIEEVTILDHLME